MRGKFDIQGDKIRVNSSVRGRWTDSSSSSSGVTSDLRHIYRFHWSFQHVLHKLNSDCHDFLFVVVYHCVSFKQVDWNFQTARRCETERFALVCVKLKSTVRWRKMLQLHSNSDEDVHIPPVIYTITIFKHQCGVLPAWSHWSPAASRSLTVVLRLRCCSRAPAALLCWPAACLPHAGRCPPLSPSCSRTALGTESPRSSSWRLLSTVDYGFTITDKNRSE